MKTAAIGSGLSAQRLQRITEHLQRNYIEPGKIVGCQTLVARHGELAYVSALGQMDRERNKPLRDDTIFRIYSMTKPITSVALMMLYEDGLFQLNDPVHRIIPQWRDLQVYVSGELPAMETRPAERPITFRHLLSHTGGLSYGGGPVPTGNLHPVDAAYRARGVQSSRDSLQTLVEKLARMPLRCTPGERFLYSCSTDVCGYLVEALSGQRFDVFLQERIFGPLGMHDTSFMITPDKLERLAASYQRGLGKELNLVDDPAESRYARLPVYLSGGGGLLSTIHDYYRFCDMLRRGGELDGARILGPRTLRLMTMNHLPGGRDLAQLAIGAFSETSNEGVGFGLGFATTLDEVTAGGFGAGDFFWGGLASTLFWVDPREDLIVIFLTQLIPSRTFDFRGQLRNLVYSSIVD
jgi:CubicO group peptidase (beta-lactamase class C family)